MLQKQPDRFVNQVDQFFVGLADGRFEVGIVAHESGHGLGALPPFGMGTGGELVTGCAHTVTGGEQSVDRGHTVVNFVFVTDFVCFGYPVKVGS